jgi:hypothetical protein
VPGGRNGEPAGPRCCVVARPLYDPRPTMLRTLVALAAAATLAVPVSAQQLRFAQLPDNHFLGESATQNQASGTPNYWGVAATTGRRFQILYDASHFTGVHGVTGPIVIRHMRFRGEDTEHNVGGQTYTGVTASLYRTSLSSAAPLSTTFAANVLPASTTLLGTIAVPVLTVGASSGRAPNDDVIDLDFTGAPMLPYDPTPAAGAQVNLLLDVTYLTATNAPDPQASAMVPIQDTSGTTAFVRGRALYAAGAALAAGTGASTPPTLRVEYTGPGGFAALVPARTERYGAGCGGAPSACYQLFPHGTYFDLKDPGQADQLAGLRFVPNQYPAPAFYTVTGGAAPVDLANGLLAAPTSQGDDVTVPHTLPAGATFDYPGAPVGGTSVIRAATNGYVLVDPASIETLADFDPTLAEFLGTAAGARFAPFWHDFSPNKNATPPFGNAQSGLHVVNHAAGNQVLVTWYRVGRFNSVAQVFQESHTLQCSLNWATGVVEFRYGAMGEIWGDTAGGQVSGITGFARGRIGTTPSVDPGSRDLSIERPFATSVEGTAGNIVQTAVASPLAGGPVHQARAYGGQSLRWNVANVPAGALLGAQLLDVAGARPGLQLPGVTAPGCVLSTTTLATLWEITVFPPASVAGTVPLVVPGGHQPALQGFELFAQYVVLDGLFAPGPLLTSSSNAIRHVVGGN